MVPLGRMCGVRQIDNRHHAGISVNHIVEHMFHYEACMNVFALVLTHDPERMWVSLERVGTSHDPREPVAGAAGAGILHDVASGFAE